MKWLKNMLRHTEAKTPVGVPSPYITEYKGLSEFLLNASPENKNALFTEAANRASEYQRQTLERAGVTL